ncbi:MAG: bifunctional 4-hydroxy-2-oxoglutarate aldolase/2-dehydro-3-deoxy-phosphogluconate aldolase [Anaerolineaceae bacterium]|nr:bifunctional 4-hydroxy-2-oxoglutarate aldolase/2-dehydro-3-deoxy-phosphogluconate aldolase [Anaerolineaceae bacterium]MDE0329113.1 bifunctional 4-hydroxy-2-oxoglutarate aldolase/2-dehydro-3-deoxy-phosphogluconate aldolase [Anaerolineaceae bacterium]
MNAVLDELLQRKLLAGMRGHFPPDLALPLCAALVEEGINIFEFTLNSTEPVAAMQAVKAELGPKVFCGMGTVLSADDARQIIDAGADFIVSPAFQPEVVQVALDADLLVAPGVMTPSECVQAWDMGVDLLKFFPAGPLGLDFFRALRGPLRHMRFLANGNITPDNLPGFLDAGAACSGLSGWLTGDGSRPLHEIRARARQLMAALQRQSALAS